MCRSSLRRRVLELLLALLAAAGTPGAAAAATAGPPEVLVLAASLDDEPAEEPVVVCRRGTMLLAAARDLRRLGLPARGDGEVALAEVPGLSWTLDEGAQAIAFRLDRPGRQRLRALRSDEAGPTTRAGWGAILSYDASAGIGRGRDGAAALLDGSFFSPAGHAFVSVLGGTAGVRRLDTGFTAADPARARRLVVGDLVAGGGGFDRPVRLGGVRYGTDFSLRPQETVFPLPQVRGTASVPSAVDLVVNGGRRPAGAVRAGGFAVTDVPVRAGVNTVTVAVRDALGRETLRSVSVYASRSLLRPGLSAFSLEAGAVRTGYATEYDRYRGVAWSADFRRGVTDALTLGASGQGDRHGAAVGGSATLAAGSLGQLDLAADASAGNGTGVRLRAGFERIGGRTSLAARYTRTIGRWRDVAARYGAPVRRGELVLNLGFDLGALGTASAGLIELGRDRNTVRDGRARLPLLAAEPSRLVTGSYAARLGRGLSLLATAGVDVRRRGSGYALVGLAAALGPRTAAYAGGRWDAGGGAGSVELSRRALLPGELGFQLGAAAGGRDRLAAGAEYQGSRGWYQAQVERIGGGTAARLSARGTLVATGDGVFAGTASGGSVAVVDVGGQPGVRVYRDNRLAGVTDRRGRLVVAGLNPYEATKLSVRPEEVSDSFGLAASEVTVRPPERAGVRVRFAVTFERGLLVRLVDERGRPLPAGSRATVGRDGARPVGLDGALYLDRYAASNAVSVRTPDGRGCVAHVAAPATQAPVLVLGDVTCRPVLVANASEEHRPPG